MRYLYLIRLSEPELYKPTICRGIVELEDKQAVVKYLSDTYPEYFDGNRVAQKLTKKSKQIVYVNIYELVPGSYWDRYWTSKISCCVCGKELDMIDVRNHIGDVHVPTFTCSPECEAQKDKVLQEKREQANDEYWSNLCDYYYIYKITNKQNGKCYIGYTEREPVFRWWEHVKHSELPIGKALKSEGLENFTFEILERHHKDSTTIQSMHELETAYMMEFNSIDGGYNCIVSKTPVVASKKLFDAESL